MTDKTEQDDIFHQKQRKVTDAGHDNTDLCQIPTIDVCQGITDKHNIIEKDHIPEYFSIMIMLTKC